MADAPAQGRTVVLAEKPSVARDIAQVLGAGERHDGYLAGNGYLVTWALGHLAELKPPEAYRQEWKRWSLETLPIIPPKFELQPRGDAAARKQLAVVSRLLRSASQIIGATDAGREGELILRYILALCGCEGKPLRRLWLSSLTPEAIRQAMANLRPGADFEPLYRAARCRSEADWIVGLNATRNFTVRHRQSGTLWSAGRVQTPVLAMLVHRDHEIRVFRPEPFWELVTRRREVLFRFTGGRFSSQPEAQQKLEQAAAGPLQITNVQERRENLPPPLLYDLTELQRDMNRRYGMSAADVLSHAQSLYESKLITYPRTDSRYLTRAVQPEIPSVLRTLVKSMPEETAPLDFDRLDFSSRIVNDARVGEHHAIIPTARSADGLSGARERVYRAIAVRLIAVFYPPCRKAVTVVDGQANGVPFRATGVRVLEPGWTALYPRSPKRSARDNDEDGESDDEAPAELPRFERGDTGPHEPQLKEGRTRPPPLFTENTLLGAMETAGRLVDDESLKEALKERGLGTPATRAAIIETLLERGYIRREGKHLVATDLGRYLISLVQEPSLKSPELTGQWEAWLRQIEQGQLDAHSFMRDIAAYTSRIIASSDLEAIDTGRLGDCPQCGKPMIEGKRDFGCSGWQEGCDYVLSRRQGDRELSIDEVRRLLQKQFVPPSGEGPQAKALVLFGGAVLELAAPSPSLERPRGGKKGGRGSRRPGTRKRGSSGRRAGPAARRAALGTANEPAPGEPPRRQPGRKKPPGKTAGARKTPARKTASRSPSKKAPAGADRSHSVAGVGKCPLCGSPVVEEEQGYRCDARQSGCRFVIGKQIAGRDISAEQARELLQRGRTSRIEGFQSKSGAAFSARLIIDNGQVRFDFG